MKWFLGILGIFLFILLTVYFWPVPQRDFSDLAAKVSLPLRQSLLDFRTQHPAQQLQVDNHEWRYVAQGDGPESVLFLHEMTGAYDIWRQQMEALSPQYRLISLTYPAVDTLEGMSQGVLAILDKEGVQQTVVVGSSLGGYFAQYLMANYPERIRGAVFANTFPPNDLLAAKNASLIKVLPLPAPTKFSRSGG